MTCLPVRRRLALQIYHLLLGRGATTVTAFPTYSLLILLPLELLPTHRTQTLRRVLLDPGQQAVHVERVPAFADQQRTVVAGELAGRACAVELHAADAAHFVFRHVPAPGGHCVPGVDLDFHFSGVELGLRVDWETEQSGEVVGLD